MAPAVGGVVRQHGAQHHAKQTIAIASLPSRTQAGNVSPSDVVAAVWNIKQKEIWKTRLHPLLFYGREDLPSLRTCTFTLRRICAPLHCTKRADVRHGCNAVSISCRR